MLVCQFVWATKTIALGTCLVADTCFMISASRPGKQVVRASRVMESAHNAENPSWSSCLSISWGGRSHARILRPSSSHKLDSILIPLELAVSIYFETIIQLRVRRRHTNPPHLFTFYLTHAHFVLYFTREISLIFFEKKNQPWNSGKNIGKSLHKICKYPLGPSSWRQFFKKKRTPWSAVTQ